MYYRYNTAGGPGQQAAFAQPRGAGSQNVNRYFSFYQAPNARVGGPSYPARYQLSSPTNYPPGNRNQTSSIRSGTSATALAPVGVRAPQGQQPNAQPQRQFTQQEIQAYEERSLHRAIRLSMLEY